jgi:hypothetical protein
MISKITAVALALAFVVATTVAAINPAVAGNCVTVEKWYVPYNCSVVGKTAKGSNILVCC